MALIQFQWVSDESREAVRCGCGGTFEPLRVEPDRSKSYLVRIWLCDGCKTVIPFEGGRKVGEA